MAETPPRTPPRPPPPRVRVLGSTRLARVALTWLTDQGRARVVGWEPGAEDESLPWFAPMRQLARDLGVPVGGAGEVDLTLDLDPDARPTRGEGVMVRAVPPSGAPSADVNRALLGPGPWDLAVVTPDGTAAWAVLPLEPHPDDTGATLLETATLRGVEALAESFEAILGGGAPQPLPRPLVGGRWRAQESFVLWERPAELIVRRVRACAGPWGGARTTAGETVVWLQDARLVPDEEAEGWLPGTVVRVDDGLTIASGRGLVRVEWIRPAWRPLRRAGDWAREVGLGPGYQIG